MRTTAEIAPPRICLVAPLPPPYGGIARWTQILTAHARRTGRADLQVVDTAPRWRELHDLRPWRRWLLGGLHGLALLGQVAWRLLRGCRVLHLTTSGQLAVHRDILMLRLARALGVRSLYHLRFGRIPELATADAPEWRRLVKALRLATTTLAIDQQTERTLRAHLPNLDLRLIPNCADVEALPTPAPLGGDPPTALFLGWVIPAKGIEELLQAWTALGEARWKLVIAGPVEPAYHQDLAARYPLGGVAFTGALPHGEAMETLAQADLFVLPSHTEGFPNVIAEAMALGRPILTTAVGAIPEMLEGGCGRVVPPREVPALQSALRDLMDDAALRESMGRAALAKLQRDYALDAVFARLLALWREPAA